MEKRVRPSAGGARSFSGPAPPWRVAIVGPGRVGGALAAALQSAGHDVVAQIGRTDEPRAAAAATVVMLTVPDDALAGAASRVAPHLRPDAVVAHTSGIWGLDPVRVCGPRVAAVHPAIPVPTPTTTLSGAVFGVTCPDELRPWCSTFVESLEGTVLWVAERDRARYHAALSMASNFAVALAADAADLLGGVEPLIPLLRATTDNIVRLGPDTALTGPVVRGDAGTVRAHLRALPDDLVGVYVANARRALARALGAGRLASGQARAVGDVLDGAGR